MDRGYNNRTSDDHLWHSNIYITQHLSFYSVFSACRPSSTMVLVGTYVYKKLCIYLFTYSFPSENLSALLYGIGKYFGTVVNILAILYLVHRCVPC